MNVIDLHNQTIPLGRSATFTIPGSVESKVYDESWRSPVPGSELLSLQVWFDAAPTIDVQLRLIIDGVPSTEVLTILAGVDDGTLFFSSPIIVLPENNIQLQMVTPGAFPALGYNMTSRIKYQISGA